MYPVLSVLEAPRGSVGDRLPVHAAYVLNRESNSALRIILDQQVPHGFVWLLDCDAEELVEVRERIGVID